MTGTKSLVLALSVVACCFVAACGDDDAVWKYFARQQLNQLPDLRIDMKLGAVFVAERKTVNHDALGNMFDTYGQAGWIPEALVATDPSRVLPSLDQSTAMEPSVAVDLIGDFLQVQVNEGLITTNVKINSIVARTRTVAAPTIDRYLQSPDSLKFREYLADVHEANPNLRISVVYRLYRTNRLSIISERGEDISSGVNFNVDGVVSIGAGFRAKSEDCVMMSHGLDLLGDGLCLCGRRCLDRAKRTLVDKIEIDGETDYAFAVGVALIRQIDEGDPLSYRVSWADSGYMLPAPRLGEDRYATSIAAGGFGSFEFVEARELGLQPHPSLQ